MKQEHVNIQNCFFCDKLTFSNEIYHTKEEFKNIQKLIGMIPETFGGKVGNKIICNLCIGDIYSITTKDDLNESI